VFERDPAPRLSGGQGVTLVPDVVEQSLVPSPMPRLPLKVFIERPAV
jgi:hypothetical protein